MADQTSPRGPPAPAEACQQEQQQSTPVHLPTSPSATFHQHPPQQYYSPPYQNPQDPRRPQHSQPQQFTPGSMQQPYYQPQGPVGAPHHHEPYDMQGVAQSLPQTDYRQQQQQYGATGNRSSHRGYTLGAGASSGATGHAGAQYSTHSGGPAPMQQTFYLPLQPPVMTQHYYGGGHVPAMAPRHSGGGGGNSSGYGYYSNQAPTPPGYYYPQPGQYSHQHHQPLHQQGGMPDGGAPGSYASPAYAPRRPSQPVVVTGNPLPDGVDGSPKPDQQPHLGRSQTQTTNIVRGPPRKPKQSGHAIWIGNLPPQANLMSLVHHVCQQTEGLESLFLISKSNCAFANYPDEAHCLAAQQKLNETWYMSVRLVSRLRKNAVEGVQGITAPTGPTALMTTTTTTTGPPPQADGNPAVDGADPSSAITATADDARAADAPATPKKPTTQTSLIVDGSGSGARGTTGYEAKRAAAAVITPAAAKGDRYFILKSLTVEDLELSVRTGIWATQSHNEETLNDAFKSCENVYLVFSANKSGEYFGYARMTSEINQDPTAAIAFAPAAQAFNGVDLPKAIPTEATETTPRGRIVDDSARGTIFWEAQRDDADGDADETKKEEEAAGASTDGANGKDNKGTDGEGVDGDDGIDGADGTDSVDGIDGTDGVDGADGTDGVDGVDESKAWGKPFQLEWLSTTRLPFYRTRGMRNPLNANREIKIARDGTEVDPAIGRKLASFFHQGASNSPAASGSGGSGGGSGIGGSGSGGSGSGGSGSGGSGSGGNGSGGSGSGGSGSVGGSSRRTAMQTSTGHSPSLGSRS